MEDAIAQVVSAIQRAGRTMLACHVDPDGDSVGSMLGLGAALRRLGKEVILASPSKVGERYRFLLGWDTIVLQPKGEFDLFISLDCSDAERLGDILAFIRSTPHVPLLNIDHHVTNVSFGAVNWVDPQAVATAEMMVRLIDALGVTLDRELALPLLTGIVTDTRGFHTSNTCGETLRVASRLIDAGVDLAEIMERTMNQRPYSTICLWGKMLQKTCLDDRIIWAELTPDMSRECNTHYDSESGFVNFLVSAEEADVGVIFNDRGNGSIEVGLRSKPGVNIANVALRLGGGGHPQAAGCTVKGALPEVRQIVLVAIREALVGQNSTYS